MIERFDKKHVHAKYDEDVEWLELDDIVDEIYNPLMDFAPGEMSQDSVDELLKICIDPEYLGFVARYILNVELPPYQLVMLDVLWNKRLPLLIGTRGAAKSYTLAVYALLRMVLEPGCRIVIAGAGLRHARNVFDYMANIWDNAPVLRDIAGGGRTAGPHREVDRYQFELGDSRCWGIPIGSGEKIRGLRANYILAEEFSSQNEEVFNTVVQGFAVVSQSPMEKIKNAAVIKKLKKMEEWSDELEQLNIERVGGNQIVYSGTAFYSFNHFYKYFKKWHAIIRSKGDLKKLQEILGTDTAIDKGFNWKDYAIIRLPYTHVPDGLLDAGIISQAKATLTRGQFLMEYGAIFQTDSEGFYKRSVIEGATTNKAVMVGGKLIQFSSMREGDPTKVYILGVDPAADADNAAIVIIEINEGHRRIVHCWTTNKKRHNELKKLKAKDGVEISDDYYRFIARKIRSLMKIFNVERIMMDKHGGGTAIAESLKDRKDCTELGDIPVYEFIDPEKQKMDDMEMGAHILELVAPNQDLNRDANHGMLKDFQEKILLFPLFDSIEVAKSVELDGINDIKFDTYEDLVMEIEDLKNEITSIVMKPSSFLGKESFDTPANKKEGSKQGHTRKDRYSALLYANYYIRNRDQQRALVIEYKPTGGTKDTKTKTTNKDAPMYQGFGLAGFKNGNNWLKGKSFGYVKHN